MPLFDPANVVVEDALECLGIRNVSQATAEEMRFSCPFPNHENGDENASAYMNVETTVWFCHGCKERGNIVHFVSSLLDVSQLEAIRLLKDRYQRGYLNPDAVSIVDEVEKIFNAPRNDPPAQPLLPDDALDRFEIEWDRAHDAYEVGAGVPPTDYMFERGFTAQSLASWGFGYDPITDRITLPIHDENGNLIGFKGRAYDDRQPKYLVLGDKPNRPARYGWPCYFPSRVVFGAHRVPDAGRANLVICEGEFNVVALDQKLGVPAVAINGSHFTSHHARIIKKIADRATIFMDSDTAGEEATKTIVEHLMPFMAIKIVPPHEGDPADMTESALVECLDQAESALVRSVRQYAKIPE